MKDIEIVVFNDKSWVRFTEYQKLQEDFEQKLADSNKNWNDLVNGWVADYREIEQENEQLKLYIAKMKKDVEELKLGSFDAGMFNAVDEVLIEWKKKKARKKQMKKVVYVCYDAIWHDAYNDLYDKVVKVVATEEQAKNFEQEDMSSRCYEEFEVEEE